MTHPQTPSLSSKKARQAAQQTASKDQKRLDTQKGQSFAKLLEQKRPPTSASPERPAPSAGGPKGAPADSERLVWERPEQNSVAKEATLRRETHAEELHQDTVDQDKIDQELVLHERSEQDSQQEHEETEQGQLLLTPQGDMEAKQEPVGVKESEITGHTAQGQEARMMAQSIVTKAFVGQDLKARQVVMLDVEVPGKGHARVRIRREGEGSVSVRIRAENESLGRELRRHKATLAQGLSQANIKLESLEILG